MQTVPFYNAEKTYYQNFEEGPFGIFADTDVYDDSLPNVTVTPGLSVKTPFGVPAGPLLNGAYVKAALDKGFDLPIYKTVRTNTHSCHKYPNVLPIDVEGDLTLEKADAGLITKDSYSAPLSITNSFGVPSYTPDVWQPDLAEAVLHAKEGQLVGASFQGTKWGEATLVEYIGDWVTAAKLVAETKAPFLEANLSCPNEGTTALLCYDVERVATISRAIKDAIGDVPLFLKISYFKDPAELERLIMEVGDAVDGYATINTISAEVRDTQGNQALPGEGRLRSGVCGHGIKWAGLDMVKKLVSLREAKNQKYSIVGVGGVMNPDDYQEYITAGADIVMSATGAMWNPNLAIDIKNSLNT
ncbi:MAG: dihydroorotate dehydrogenase (NAD+) catalytic subunit [Candidatus Azotimanducaceae bacterium]|jgi:dihydroorotate dehydrogenase (NAD+) catalytic subunit